MEMSRAATAGLRADLMRRARLILVLATLAGIAIVAGCGQGSSSERASGQTGAAGGVTHIPAELTIASSQKILTLDPDLAADGYSECIVHLLGGTLYELGNNGAIVPLLAASKAVSPDGLTWTFELKPNLQFSDGTALTAVDVKGTLERAKLDRENLYAGFVAPIAHIEALSPTRVVLHLSRPYPSLPVVFSQPEMTILPTRGLAAGARFFEAPVSAGQYRLESWRGSPTAVLVRNPYYAGAAPAVARLTFETIDDLNARFAQVLSGEVDFATDIPSRLLLDPPRHIVTRLTPRYGFISLPLNVGRAPLNQIGVRRAIAKAIDRNQLNRVVWNGMITPVSGFWPSTMRGYDRNDSVNRDLQAAKADLKGTSCEAGCTVRILYSPVNPWSEPTVTVVAQNLKDIGIDAEMEKVDDVTFNARLAAGDFQIAVSLLYDYNDVPDGLLTYALIVDGGLRANFTGFRAPADLDLAVKHAITEEGPAREAALADINRLFLTYQPFVTLSDYAIGSVSRYAPGVVRANTAGCIDIARRGHEHDRY
jgi:peptide/nickel transport system substrate-binding protein